MNKSKVAVVRCETYDKSTVYAAVKRGVDLLGGLQSLFRPGEKILLKPNLLVGDFLLVNKLVYRSTDSVIDRLILPKRDVRRGDVIVFKYPENLSKDFVKRVVGLPGDTVECKRKRIFVNGAPLDDPFAFHGDPVIHDPDDGTSDARRDNFGPVTVPPHCLFAMGDNRDNSLDSRYWGFVPMANLKGRPWILYYSYAPEPDLLPNAGLADRLKKIVGFISRARFKRLLKVIH